MDSQDDLSSALMSDSHHSFPADSMEVEEVHKGTASVSSSVFNLSNTILGAGTLAMAFACKTVGVLLFLILLSGVALLANYSVSLLGLAMVKAQKTSTRDAASFNYPALGMAAMGRKGQLAASWSVILQQLGPCIIYIQILADVFLPIIGTKADPDSIACSRAFWQIIIVILVIFPLCMLKNLDSLKYTSFAAVFFILAFTIAVFGDSLKVLSDTSIRADYHTASLNANDCGGGGSRDIDAPGDTAHMFRINASFFQAVPIVCFAFLCHMNVFPLYAELKDASVERLKSVSKYSLSICLFVYFFAGAFGYLTFLESTQGDLLKNYAISGTNVSTVMDILRVGFGLALIFSYPVVIYELRHCLDELIFGHRPYSIQRTFILNVGIIGFSTILAIFISSIEIVFGFIGSTCSPLLIFVLPSLFYLRLLGAEISSRERMKAQAMMVFGFVLIPVSLAVWGVNL